MFSVDQRDHLRDLLIEEARADGRISAAALVGSMALDAHDEWSDIDLALRIKDGLEPTDVADVWTERMYTRGGAVDHLDIWSGPTLFRVFLLTNSLQVDLSFWPSETFAASGASFRLLFGEANEPRSISPPAPGDLIGMGWLYALHARSSIARGRDLQAVHMIDGVRDHAVSLACLRHGLPSLQGRGVDRLPAPLRQMIALTRVQGQGSTELHRAFARSVDLLLAEAAHVDPDREVRLRGPAGELVRTAGAGPSQHDDNQPRG